MKKVLLSLLVIVLALQLDAQVARKAFVEEATQASCPPCASFNPGVQALLNDNTETTIFIGYQVWWPGFDQMYLDNPSEVDDRINYYGVTAAPSILVQGTNYEQTFNQSQINNVTDQESEFSLDIAAEVVNGEVIVTGNIEAVLEASGDLKLRIALVEELITIEDAPGGTNGETEYHHVFKKFIGDGGADGIALADNWMVGDTYDINETLMLGSFPIYHYDGLEVVAWIQNDDDKFVHQAAKATNLSITTDYATNGTGVEISGLPATICSGDQTIAPVFRLQNGGNDTLTSATIIYSVNGGAEQTMAWTGSLSTLATEDVTLDPISFVAGMDDNIINVRVTEPNGLVDENADDNAVETTLAPAASTTEMAELTIVTDNYGNETYWQISDDLGNVIYSGGNAGVGLVNIGVGGGSPPSDPGAYGNNQTIVEELTLPSAGCFALTFTDYWGDGICCAYGTGSYILRDHEGNEMLSGGEFGARNDDNFEGVLANSVQDEAFVANFKVTPNPVIERALIEFSTEEAATATISVMNALGQVVRRSEMGKLPAGSHNIFMDMSNLNAGIYMINVVSGTVSGTKKVILAK